MKSGPDVFADALVPGTPPFPERARSPAVALVWTQPDPSTGDGKKPPIIPVYLFLPGRAGPREWFAIAIWMIE